MRFILIYFWLINFVTMIFYIVDKKRAERNKWRISENTLILLAWIGGSIGALVGMFAFRHKTKHIKFIILVPLALIVQIFICLYIFDLLPFRILIEPR